MKGGGTGAAGGGGGAAGEGRGERLQKILAEAGVASRRGAVPLIESGRVRVNGVPATEPGMRADPARDRITLDGRPLRRQAVRTYLADKPRGVICTSRDPQGRTTLVEWARAAGADPALRLYGVGRLDYDSEGLILLTNDGELAQRLSHPSHHARKEYRVWLDRLPDAGRRRAILRGVEDRGELLRALEIKDDPPARAGGAPSLRLVLGEGRNRHIRRMMEALGLRVVRLRRIRIGTLTEGLLRGKALRELPEELLAPLVGR